MLIHKNGIFALKNVTYF